MGKKRTVKKGSRPKKMNASDVYSYKEDGSNAKAFSNKKRYQLFDDGEGELFDEEKYEKVRDDEEIDSDDAFGEDDVELKKKFSNIKSNEKEEVSDNEDEVGDLFNDAFEEISEEREEEGEEDDHARTELVDAILGMKDDKQEEAIEKLRSEMNESEYNLSGDGTSLVDLSKVLSNTSGNREAKKHLRTLAKSGYEGGVDALEKPQSQVYIAKQIRKEGYRMTTEDLNKWNGVDVANAKREHTSFPLNQPSYIQTVATMTSNFAPETDFEKGMSQLLNESEESKIQKEEDLKMIELTPEQVLQRQKELARLRSLMFFQDIKNKRKAKIKSKAYHKILRRDKMRQEEQTYKELFETDPEAAKEYREKLERDRIIERMTLKHKNSSKWAKQMHKKGLTKITGVRRAIEQQLEINRQLERKIAAMGEDEESDTESKFLLDEDKKDHDEELDLDDIPHTKLTTKEKMRQNAIAKIKALDELNSNAKGLLSLSFIAKDRAIQRASLQKFLDNIDDYDDDGNNTKENSDDESEEDDIQSDVDDEDVKEQQIKKKINKQKKADQALAEALKKATEASGGRRIFQMNKNNNEPAPEGGNKNKSSQPTRPKKFHAQTTDSLTLSIRQALEAKKKVESDVSLFEEVPFENKIATTKLPEKPSVKLPEIQKPSEEKPSEEKPKKETKTANTEKPVPNEWLENKGVDHAFDNGDSDSDILLNDVSATDSVPPPVLLGSGTNSQKALLAQAFADDGAIEKEWYEEKEREAREEAEGDNPFESKVVAGWGSWTGEGTHISKAQAARKLREKKLHEQKVREALKKRSDSKMKNVVLNQKLDKIAAEYTLTEAPREYSKDQYNAIINIPIGKDWNTMNVHKAVIKPAISVKKGSIIDPIKLSKQIKKQYAYGVGKKK